MELLRLSSLTASWAAQYMINCPDIVEVKQSLEDWKTIAPDIISACRRAPVLCQLNPSQSIKYTIELSVYHTLILQPLLTAFALNT